MRTIDRIKKLLVADNVISEMEVITDHTTFDELAMDSLDNFKIISDAEDEFDIELPERTFATVGELADYIDTHRVRCYR